MKKMKRFLVAMLSCLTAIACVAGISACKKDTANNDSNDTNSSVVDPSYDININWPTEETPAPCVHDFSVEYAVVKEATCDAAGAKVMGCSKCGEKMNIVVSPIGHDWGEATCDFPVAECVNCGTQRYEAVEHTWVAATCTEDGYCSVCNAVNEEDEALGHTIVEVEATCEADAYDYCEVCDYSVTYEGTAHEWASAFGTGVETGTWQASAIEDEETGIYYIPAACEADGYKAFDYCKTCYDAWFNTEKDSDLAWYLLDGVAEKAAYLFGSGKISTKGYEVIPAAHTMVNYFGTAEEVAEGEALVVAEANEVGEYIAATCTTEGVKNFKACKVCVGDKPETLDDIRAHFVAEDEEDEVAVSEGYAETAALGHTSKGIDADGNEYDTFVAGKLAACEVEGVQWSATCTVCGAEMNENIGVVIEALEHVYDAEAVTCEAGVDCELCGELMVPALGHDMQAAAVDYKAPTCTEAGWSNLEVCANGCGKTEYIALAKVPHSYELVVNTIDDEDDVTCVMGIYKDGIYQCEECEVFAKVSNDKFVTTTDIWAKKPNNNHTMSSDFEAATCLTPAVGAYCEACEKAWNATWTDIGNTDADGEFVKYSANEISAKALGHSFKTGYKASCTEEGRCTRELCYFSYDEDEGYAVVPAYDHEVFDVEADAFVSALVPHDAVAPTCEKAGNRAYFECSVCDRVSPDGNEFEYIVGSYEVEDEENPGTYVTIDVFVEHSVSKGGSLYIEAAEHTYVTVEAQVATCFQIGWAEYEVCVGCDKKVGYKEVAMKKHASDIASCADYVACNCSYLVLEDGTIVDKAGWYKEDVNGEWVLVEENTPGAEEATWVGCGELTETTNKVDCTDHNQNGECVVCGREVAHSYEEGECTVCGKEEDE